MVASAIIASLFVAAASAVAVPSKQPATSCIKTEVTHGQAKFNNQYLQGFHTGAGENAVVGVKSSTDAARFYFQNTDLLAKLGDYVYGLELDHGLEEMGDKAPKDYNYVALNVGNGGTGDFSKDADGKICFSNPSFAFDTFALCNVTEISANDLFGPDLQLLWRTASDAPVYGSKCADVDLYYTCN